MFRFISRSIQRFNCLQVTLRAGVLQVGWGSHLTAQVLRRWGGRYQTFGAQLSDGKLVSRTPDPGSAVQEERSDVLLCVSRGFLWQLCALAGVLLLLFFAGHVLLVAFGAILVATTVRGIAIYVESVPFISSRWSYALVLGTIAFIASALV